MDLADVLTTLPFTAYERAVIMYLSSVDSAIGRQISYRAHIPQGRVYGVLGDLVRTGIVTEVPGRPKSYHIENARVALHAYMEAERAKLARKQELIANVSLTTRTPTTSSSSVAIYRGKDEHVQAIIALHNTAKETFIRYSPYFFGSAGSQKSLLAMLDRGVAVRVILPAVNPTNRVAVRRALAKGAHIRLARLETLPAIAIRDDDEIVMVVNDFTYNEERVAIRTRQPAIVRGLREEFERAWKHAKPVPRSE